MVGDAHLKLPTVENKVNWTTLIAAFGVAVTIGGWAFTYGRFTQRVDSIEMASSERRTVIESRMNVLEAEVRKIDNLAYRMAMMEQTSVTTIQTLSEISKSLADQAADIKVIREILARVDTQPKKLP